MCVSSGVSFGENVANLCLCHRDRENWIFIFNGYGYGQWERRSGTDSSGQTVLKLEMLTGNFPGEK